MADGKADSELAVAKAIEAGLETADMNFKTGILKSRAMGSKTSSRKAISAT
jgi:hypothetical protein